MKEKKYIYRAWTTTKNGERIYARNYGLRAFRIEVDNDFES